MVNFKKSEWVILVGLLLLSFVPCVGGVLRLVELGIGLEFMPENPRVQAAPIPVVVHILTSVIYCILGAFQFIPTMRRAYPKWHRVAGRMLVGAGIISALSGLWMTHFYLFTDELQGSLLYFVRIVVSFAMVACIVLGLTEVLKKRIIQHQAWMIRAYALAQGAGTQVILGIPWMLIFGESTGFTRDLLMTAAWVINIVISERIISKR